MKLRLRADGALGATARVAERLLIAWAGSTASRKKAGAQQVTLRTNAVKEFVLQV